MGFEMGNSQKFGGDWTIEKLDILSDYLTFYLAALKDQKFGKVYIDAFAGCGKIETSGSLEEVSGSARIALQAKSKFDKYIFIEKKADYAQELKHIVDSEFPELASRVTVYNTDCNDKLIEICADTEFWLKNRAVLFLDPCATEVKWAALEAIAKTEAIDLWYLFPFSATQRMLPKKGIVDSWRAKLNDVFGNSDWEDRIYRADLQTSMFDDKERMIKDINTKELAVYIVERLKSIFPYVADNPRLLYNTKRSPLFMFCFAVANPSIKAQRLAKKVAEDHILKKRVLQ